MAKVHSLLSHGLSSARKDFVKATGLMVGLVSILLGACDSSDLGDYPQVVSIQSELVNEPQEVSLSQKVHIASASDIIEDTRSKTDRPVDPCTDDDCPPPPPPASAAVLGPKPEIAGLDYLATAGLDTAGLFNERWVTLCELHLYARKPFIGPPRTDEGTCISGPPPGYKVLLTKIRVISEGNCSRSNNTVRAGTDYSSLSEIDRIYGKAIEFALKEGKLDVALKLGQMRDYHKSILQVSSKTDVFSMWGKATSGTGFGTNGWCDLALDGLLIKD